MLFNSMLDLNDNFDKFSNPSVFKYMAGQLVFVARLYFNNFLDFEALVLIKEILFPVDFFQFPFH